MRAPFSLAGLIRRTAAHQALSHVLVAVAVAVAAAVITGALLVGDSIRGSLEDRVRERLGRIHAALVAPRPFREELPGAMAADPAVRDTLLVPALLAAGTAEHATSSLRAAGVSLIGVPPSFRELGGEGAPALEGAGARGVLEGRRVVLNARLASEIGAVAGDSVVLHFRKESDVPAEHALGRRSETLRSLRLEVDRVVPDAGLAVFTLENVQQAPRNAFVPLATLQRALELDGLANAILAAPGKEPAPDLAGRLDRALAASWRLEDAGLRLRADPERGHASLETREMILPSWIVEAGSAAADALGLERLESLSYLANTIRGNGREVPYSVVAAAGEWRPGSVPAVPGLAPAAAPGEGVAVGAAPLRPIVLNEWAAEDLAAKPGDEVEIVFNTVTEAHRLVERTARFRVRAVEPLAGPAADPGWTPEYPGITDADTLGEWDPPFPMDLKRIRPRDEDYWDKHRTTPKAFIPLDAGRELWSSRFGETTSLRVRARAGDSRSIDSIADALRARMLAEIPPSRAGLAFRPVMDEALAAARSGTDFGALFLGLSSFIIISALVLISMLFRLACERRAREMGILAAAGFGPGDIRRLLLATGASTAVLGALLGAVLSLAYAAVLLAGLRTWWKDAVNAPFLSLHASAASIAIGMGSSLLLSLITVWLVASRFSRTPPRVLLGGSPAGDPAGPGSSRRAPALARLAPAVALGAAAAALVGLAASGRIPEEAGFFGGGALLLASLLAVANHAFRRPPRTMAEGTGVMAIARMGVRQAGRAPGRSLLCAILIACAAFIITAVASRVSGGHSGGTSSGSGGISVLARASIPLLASLDSPAGREDLGVSPATSELLGRARTYALRVRPGDDASCLNLHKPASPRIAAVPDRFRERGGFAWDRTLAETEEERSNPWRLLDRLFPAGDIPAVGDANTVKWILRSGLGEELVVPADGGREVKLRIVGLLSKSIFQGELIVSEGAFLRAFPSSAGQSLFLFETASPADAQKLEQAIEKDLGEQGVDAVSAVKLLEEYQKVENTYLSTFQVLGALGLLLGTFGLGAVLLRNVNERRGELAVLRAVGWPGRAIAAMVLSETLYLLVLGLGAGILAAGIAILPSLRGGGVRLIPLVLSLAAVLAAGVLSAGIAVRMALRGPILAALRRE